MKTFYSALYTCKVWIITSTEKTFYSIMSDQVFII
jgi:hypothetical protein